MKTIRPIIQATGYERHGWMLLQGTPGTGGKGEGDLNTQDRRPGTMKHR